MLHRPTLRSRTARLASWVGVWSIAALAIGSAAASARAQDDRRPPSEAEIDARAAVAAQMLERGDASGALRAFEALRDELRRRRQSAAFHRWSCRAGAARLRGSEPLDADAIQIATDDLHVGLWAASDEAARARCQQEGALALAAALARTTDPLSPEARETLRFRPGVWVRRARALRDTPALRAAADALGPALQAELDALSRPTLSADSPDTLADRLERARYLADPRRLPVCEVDTATETAGVVVIDCYDRPAVASDGCDEYPHFAYYALEDGNAVRSVGLALRMRAFGCVADEGGEPQCGNDEVSETLHLARLVPRQHGVSGVARVVREGWQDGMGGSDVRTFLDLCDARRATCVSLLIGVERCEDDDDDGRARCSVGWEARPTVRGGVITFRRVRGTLPAQLSSPQPIDALFSRPEARTLPTP